MTPTARAGIALIRAYQRVVSPALGSRCRFHPSCSEYAARAIGMHGALRGGRLAVCRLGRCHPWSEGGFDEVPSTVPSRRGRKAPA